MEIQKSIENLSVVVFNVDNNKYALELPVIERVIPSVEITPLPKVPEKVSGIINYHGDVIPVINIRHMFGLKEKEIDEHDQIILAKTKRRIVGLIVDFVEGILELDNVEHKKTDQKYPFAQYISSISIIEDELIIINDLDKFLSLDEYELIDNAITDSK